MCELRGSSLLENMASTSKRSTTDPEHLNSRRQASPTTTANNNTNHEVATSPSEQIHPATIIPNSLSVAAMFQYHQNAFSERPSTSHTFFQHPPPHQQSFPVQTGSSPSSHSSNTTLHPSMASTNERKRRKYFPSQNEPNFGLMKRIKWTLALSCLISLLPVSKLLLLSWRTFPLLFSLYKNSFKWEWNNREIYNYLIIDNEK
jgi:hypothetical protein